MSELERKVIELTKETGYLTYSQVNELTAGNKETEFELLIILVERKLELEDR